MSLKKLRHELLNESPSDYYSQARTEVGADLEAIFADIQQRLDSPIEVINQVIAECREHAETQDSAYVISPGELKEIFESIADRLQTVVDDRGVG